MSVYVGTGTLLKVGNGASPEVFTTVAQISDVGDVGFGSTVLDTTTHNAAVAVPWKTKISGLRDAKQISLKVFWDANDTTHGTASAGLRGLAENANTVNIQIALPAAVSPAAKFTSTGFFSDFKTSTPLDGVIMADVTFTPSGKVSQA